ncbi:uncharacterized protein [Dysidea avara]|uniref:uncharacterized protein n=1 Tax=Dysidea avara TaxID=196820 RepID=UPI003322F755
MWNRIPQNLNIQFCKCKRDALTLVELGYWPGTPSQPLVAFSFSFMDWMEALLRECQVSVQDFTNAVEIYLQENIVQMPCSIYPVLIDTFEEYRHAKGKLRMLHEICDDSTKPCFNSCPACPKDNGMLTLSIDANFGLCRKKSAGSSVHPPLSGSSMFLNQEEVDEYVCQYSTHPTCSTEVSEGCSEFLAGSALRYQNRYSALKETAVMGVVCRHEFPKCFLNLHHGERISYCVYLLEKLKDLYPNHSIQLMYDISCLLVKHLVANKRTDLLEGFEFAIPVFHAYGHTSQCQILRNPRNITGFGLSDGEVVERLWSFLRRFSAMTKEMRPSHRVDVLTDALLYYCRKIAKKIGQLLCKRMRHAKDVLNNATASLDILKQSSSEPLSEDDIECWSSEMMQNISRNSLPHEILQSWQEEYVSLLDKISSVMNALESSGFDNHVLGISYMLIIDQKIQEIEQKHGIQTRWLDDCPEYFATKSVIQSKEKQKLKLKMRDQAKERWYLLKLKAKYADGQKIAIRLSRCINLVSKQLKGTIAKYNANQPESTQVQWKDATDLSNDIYKKAVFASSNIPHSFKAQAVELRHKISRCNEEITQLEEEMKCCSQHFIAKYMGLCQLVDTLESAEVQGRYTKGSISLLKKCLHRCRFELKSLSCLMECTQLPELEAMLTEFCRDNEVFNSDVDINDDDVENICLRNPEQDALSSSDESMLATDDEGENEQYTQWNVQENQALNNSNATEPGDDVLGGSQLQSTGSQLQSTGSQLQSTGSHGKASPLSITSKSTSYTSHVLIVVF